MLLLVELLGLGGFGPVGADQTAAAQGFVKKMGDIGIGLGDGFGQRQDAGTNHHKQQQAHRQDDQAHQRHAPIEPQQYADGDQEGQAVEQILGQGIGDHALNVGHVGGDAGVDVADLLPVEKTQRNAVQVAEQVFPQREEKTGRIARVDVVVGKPDPEAGDQENDHQSQKGRQQTGHPAEQDAIDHDLGEIGLDHPQGRAHQAQDQRGAQHLTMRPQIGQNEFKLIPKRFHL